MRSFTYHSPTEIHFGNGSVKQIEEFSRNQGYTSVLLVCATGPFRNNGLYDSVSALLHTSGAKVIEMHDIPSNPKISFAREGVSLCKRYEVDAVFALGGGSAMDAAKIIGAASAMDCDPFELIWGSRIPVTVSLPVCTIPTIASTGTEINNFAVIVDDITKEKNYCMTKHPLAAFLDPEIVCTVPRQLAIWGGMDILSHSFEFYFNGETDSVMQVALSEAIIRSTMRAIEGIHKNSTDLHAVSELMWCAIMAWGGITKIGRGDPDMTCHSIEESFSGYFDSHHGACLGVLTPLWMHHCYKDVPAPFATLARNIFGCTLEDDLAAAAYGIKTYETWLKTVDAPYRFSDFAPAVDFNDAALRISAEHTMCIYKGSIGRLHPITSVDTIVELLKEGRDRKKD
jgi:alcohol dehydrogenase YqhD (iron-dependent ADH family)